MAVRLYSEFKSDQGDQYKIEIHDSQWLAVATEFNVDSRGFELTYEGETDDIVSPIIGSKLTFGAYSTDGTFETFIDTLKSFQENRFRVVVYRSETISGRNVNNGLVLQTLLTNDDETEYRLFWVGWLTQDLVNVEDASAPYIYEITATDGIGRLANFDYDAANSVNETNGFKVSRITDVLKTSFDKIGTSDLWGASDVYFETSADWWETNAQTYSTANDPLATQGFDVRYFTQKDDDGNDVYSSVLEILRQIATLYNARIFMQRGRFVFEQYGNRDTAARYVSKYNTAGTHLGRVLVSDDIVFDQTLFGARRSGNNWNFLPAVQLAKIHYVQRFLNPFNAFGLFRFRNSTNAYTAGFIAGGSGVQLSVGSTSFNFKVVGPASLTSPIFPVFKIRIRIQDSSTGTFYYCNRTYNGYAAGGAMFGIPAWSTTPGEYFFDLPMFFSSGTAVVNYPVAIITPDIPVNGELDFLLSLHGVFRAGTGATYTPSTTPLFDSVFVFGIETNGATNAPGATFSSTNTDASVNSNLTLDLGDLFIADGPRQSGHLAAYNGASWLGTSDWRKGSSGTALPILKLLTNETLALHVRPIEQYNGNVINAFDFGQRIVFDSEAYLMTGGTYTANVDEWNGTWYRIQTIRASVSELPELPDLVGRSAIASATTSGVSPNDIVGGRIAGMAVDIVNEKIGPFEQTATGGKIDGTMEVVGNATFDANVQVDGDTTIVGTIDVTDLEVTNDLSVDGASTLGTLSAGASTLSSASVTGNTSVGGTLGVTGTATLGTLNAAATSVTTLAASSNASVGGTLGVTGTSTLGTLNAGTTTLGAATLASSNVTGNASVGGTLGVTGTATLGTLNAAATSVTTLNASGNATLGGTLGVTGATTLGTLNAGASTLASSAVTGNQTIGGTLGVTGASTLGTLNAGASTIGSATITGNTSVGGTLGVTGTATLGTLNAAATSVSTLNASGNATLGGTLGVTGATTLGTLNAGASTLASSSVTGNQTIGGTLGVTGASTLGTLNAGASTLASSSVTGNASVGGTLGVTGASTLGTLNAGTTTLGASTLASSNVTGNQTIGGTLGVTGASTLGTLNAGASTLASSSVTGNASVGGTLGVTGTATLGTLNAAATSVSTLNASGNASVGGTLGVTGTSTLGTLNAGTTTTQNLTAANAVVNGTTQLIGATRIVEELQVDRVANFPNGMNVGDTTSGIVTNGLVFGLDVSTFLMNVAGPSKIEGTFEVTAAATIGSELNVSGVSRLNDVKAAATDVSTLNASGAATIGQTLNVNGATTMGSTLDVAGRTSTEYVQLDTAFIPNGEPAGVVYWDSDAALPAVRGIDGVGIDLSEKETWYVKNQSGASIAKGSAVYAVGTLGSSGQLLIAKMIANGTINAKYFLGITQSDIANGGDGYVVSKGKIRQLNTSAWNDGDVLYVDETTAGALSDTEPQAPNLKLPVAFVVKSASNGTIAVRQTAGTYLAETHDVQIASATTNEVLARTSAGRWENKTIDSLLSVTDDTPVLTDQSSFSQVYGTSGIMLGKPETFLPVTIGGVDYLIPLYLKP